MGTTSPSSSPARAGSCLTTTPSRLSRRTSSRASLATRQARAAAMSSSTRPTTWMCEGSRTLARRHRPASRSRSSQTPVATLSDLKSSVALIRMSACLCPTRGRRHSPSTATAELQACPGRRLLCRARLAPRTECGRPRLRTAWSAASKHRMQCAHHPARMARLRRTLARRRRPQPRLGSQACHLLPAALRLHRSACPRRRSL